MSAAHLPARLQAALTDAEAHVLARAIPLAASHQLPLYLVGGGVRDLLMGRPLKDLDIVVEGDPSQFVEALAGDLNTRIAMRSQFGTAAFKVNGMNVDIVMARRETYAHPGALPAVTPATIADDLWRRDFAVHAIAMRLYPAPQELLDPTGGQRDLEAKLVRVLHPKSFQDDATRILRAVRYEQRLEFRLYPETERLLRRDLGYLDTISGDRLRRELDLAFHEASAAAFLRRAAELGVLPALHPALPDAAITASRLDRLPLLPEPPLPLTYLALLAYSMNADQQQSFTSRFNVPRPWAAIIQDTSEAAKRLNALDADARPSQVVRTLRGLALEAVQAATALASVSIQQQLALRYLAQWRHVRPILTGNDLLHLGLLQGPTVKEALETLQDARLDGKVATLEEERAFCHAFLLKS